MGGKGGSEKWEREGRGFLEGPRIGDGTTGPFGGRLCHQSVADWDVQDRCRCVFSQFWFSSFVATLFTNDRTQAYANIKDLKEAAGEMDWRSVVGRNTRVGPLRIFRGTYEVGDVFE